MYYVRHGTDNGEYSYYINEKEVEYIEVSIAPKEYTEKYKQASEAQLKNLPAPCSIIIGFKSGAKKTIDLLDASDQEVFNFKTFVSDLRCALDEKNGIE